MQTALLLIDVQQSFCARPYWRGDDVPAFLARTNTLLAGCAERGIPVVRIFHTDGPRDAGNACTVSYCMNILQSLDAPVPLVVTLNRTAAIDPARILRRMVYHHPVHTLASAAARQRRAQINGVNRTWFCGAWWGYGFHEDGMRSGVEVAAALGARWP